MSLTSRSCARCSIFSIGIEQRSGETISISQRKVYEHARKSETNLSRYDLTRGKYLEKARRSFETIVIDKKVAAALGGPEGVTAVLEALARSVVQAKKKGRAA